MSDYADVVSIDDWNEAVKIMSSLHARVAKLEAALKPFADAHFYYNDAGKPDDLTTGIGGVTYGDFRQAVSILVEGEIARAALKDAPQ